MCSERRELAGPDCTCPGRRGNRRRLLGLLGALALGLSAPACATGGSSSPERLTVLSYNIHRGVGLDGVTDLERIAAVIRASGADLGALQEVDVGTRRSAGVDQAAELGRLTGMQVVFGEAMPYDGGSYGEAVLSRLPILDHEAFALPHSPEREPRCALAVRVQVGDQVLRFVGTHLDHLADPTDRIAQAQALDAHFAVGDLPTVLAGDFNDEPGAQSLAALADHWAAVLGPDPLATFPADGPTKAIDHVFVRPAARWKRISAGLFPEPVASDHAPVRAVLELR